MIIIWNKYLSLPFLLIILSVHIIKCCDIPPDLWCDSYESAKRCNVTQQCDQFRHIKLPIKLSLYYEALCPYCQRFIANHLGNIYNQFRGLIELDMIPWGNSKLLQDGTIRCNHGPIECNANKLQSCVLEYAKMKHALAFIICFERSLNDVGVESALQYCSGFIRNHYGRIRRCYDSERGIHLQRKAFHRTMSATPNRISEVPYLLINGYTPNPDSNNLNIHALQLLLKKWKRTFRNDYLVE
ncbi:GILT-like protein [Dirofilaria immitis]